MSNFSYKFQTIQNTALVQSLTMKVNSRRYLQCTITSFTWFYLHMVWGVYFSLTSRSLNYSLNRIDSSVNELSKKYCVDFSEQIKFSANLRNNVGLFCARPSRGVVKSYPVGLVWWDILWLALGCCMLVSSFELKWMKLYFYFIKKNEHFCNHVPPWETWSKL